MKNVSSKPIKDSRFFLPYQHYLMNSGIWEINEEIVVIKKGDI